MSRLSHLAALFSETHRLRADAGATPPPPPPPPPPAPSPQLIVNGAYIYDHTGALFVDKGYCDGNTEAYEAGDAADAKAQGANIFGITIRRDGLYNQGNVVPGRNTDGKDASSSNGFWKDSYLAVMDAVVADINAQSMHIRLRFDSNCGQFGVQNPEYAAFCDPTGIFGRTGRNVWTDPATRTDYIGAITYIINRYCNTSSPKYAQWVTSIEQMVEPRPLYKFVTSPDDLFTAADVAAFYAACDVAHKTTYPNLLYLRGGNEYITNRIDQAYQAGLTQTALTCNIFAFTSSGDGSVAAVLANWESRFNSIKAVRANRNVPIIISAWGTETNGDPTRGIFQGMASRLKADGTVGALMWERKTASTNQNGYHAFYMTGTFAGAHTWVKKVDRYDDITAAWAAPAPPPGPFDSLYVSGWLPNTARDAKTLPTQAYPALSADILSGGYRDARFDVEVRRVTDPSLSPDSVNWIGHLYARQQCWNKNETLTYLMPTNSWPRLQDASTLDIIPGGRTLTPGNGGIQGPSGNCEFTWSPTNPYEAFYTASNGGLQWSKWTWNPVTQTGSSALLFDLAPLLNALGAPWTNAAGAWFKEEGICSQNGQRFGLMIDNASFGSIGIILYDLPSNTIVQSWLTGGNRPDHVSTSPSGQYVIASWYGTAQASLAAEEALPLSQANGVWALKQDGTKKVLSVLGEHSDVCYDHDGNEVFVFVSFHGTADGFAGDTIGVRRIDNPSIAYSLPINPFAGNGTGFHISGLCWDRRGWVAIEKYSGVGSGPFDGQIIIAQLKAASPQVLRIAHHRCTVGVYQDEPRVNISRSGLRVRWWTNHSNTQPLTNYEAILPSWIYDGATW